jgi:hypothetical protein
VLKDDGLIHQVHCKICIAIGKKESMMASKWNTILKHGNGSVTKARPSFMLHGSPSVYMNKYRAVTS